MLQRRGRDRAEISYWNLRFHPPSPFLSTLSWSILWPRALSPTRDVTEPIHPSPSSLCFVLISGFRPLNAPSPSRSDGLTSRKDPRTWTTKSHRNLKQCYAQNGRLRHQLVLSVGVVTFHFSDGEAVERWAWPRPGLELKQVWRLTSRARGSELSTVVSS